MNMFICIPYFLDLNMIVKTILQRLFKFETWTEHGFNKRRLITFSFSRTDSLSLSLADSHAHTPSYTFIITVTK